MLDSSKAAFYSHNEQFIYQEPRGIDAGYKWPAYLMHRGHFHQLLLRRVRHELGEMSVQDSQKFVAFRSQIVARYITSEETYSGWTNENFNGQSRRARNGHLSYKR